MNDIAERLFTRSRPLGGWLGGEAIVAVAEGIC